MQGTHHTTSSCLSRLTRCYAGLFKNLRNQLYDENGCSVFLIEKLSPTLVSRQSLTVLVPVLNRNCIKDKVVKTQSNGVVADTPCLIFVIVNSVILYHVHCRQ
jgi:hypothetical protein